MQDEKAMVGEAMNLAEKIGLEVNLGPDSCCNCCKGLVEVILEYREKGKIFQKLSKIGESKFRKFGIELKGFAKYDGKTYAVNEKTGYVELAVVDEQNWQH